MVALFLFKSVIYVLCFYPSFLLLPHLLLYYIICTFNVQTKLWLKWTYKKMFNVCSSFRSCFIFCCGSINCVYKLCVFRCVFLIVPLNDKKTLELRALSFDRDEDVAGEPGLEEVLKAKKPKDIKKMGSKGNYLRYVVWMIWTEHHTTCWVGIFVCLCVFVC